MKAILTGLRLGRRPTDNTFQAFHQACEAGNLQEAGDMLLTLEEDFTRRLERGNVRGERLRALLEAQARLWTLQCRQFGDQIEEQEVVFKRGSLIPRPATFRISEWCVGRLNRPLSRFVKAAESSMKARAVGRR